MSSHSSRRTIQFANFPHAPQQYPTSTSNPNCLSPADLHLSPTPPGVPQLAITPNQYNEYRTASYYSNLLDNYSPHVEKYQGSSASWNAKRVPTIQPPITAQHPRYYADSHIMPASKPVKRQKSIGPSSSARPQYICLIPRCEKRFTRFHDLKRHYGTHFHENIEWIDCREPGCGRTGVPQEGGKGGFGRSDHYIEHLRKVHNIEIPKGRGSGKWIDQLSAGSMSTSALVPKTVG